MHHLVDFGKSHPNIAYLYAIIGNFCMGTMQVIIKQVTHTLTAFQVVVIRSILMICFNLCVLRSNDLSPYVKDPSNFKLVVMRILAISSSSTMMLYCLQYMPVSTVSTIFNMGPIFIFFIEAIAHKKALNMAHLGLAFISFVGIMLILQPSFLFGSSSTQQQDQTFYVCMMVLAALGFALNLHIVHILSKRMHVFINVHYSHLLFLFLNGILSQFSPNKVSSQEVTLALVIMLFCVFLLTIGAQYMIMMANSIKAPSLMMPFGYVAVMIGFLADVYLFDTDFSWLAVTGIALTSSGLLSGYLIEKSTNKEEEKA